MPISKEEYDAGIGNSKLLNLFMSTPNQAYSYKELTKEYGTNVFIELQILHIQGIIEAKSVFVKGKGEDMYFRLTKKFQEHRQHL